MCSREEVSKVDEFAVVGIFDIDDSPSILSTSYLLAINDDELLAANDGEGNDFLDCSIRGSLFVIEFIVVIWVHLKVVEGELLLYSFLEGSSFFEGEGIGLGDDRDDVDNIGQLLEDDDIDRLQCMAGGLDEEQAAVDSGILDVSFSLSGELFSKVG